MTSTSAISSNTIATADPSLCLQGRELLERCKVLADGNRLTEALEVALRSLELLSGSDCIVDLAAAFMEVGLLRYSAGRYAEAIEAWLRCSQLYERIGDEAAQAKTHRNTGVAYSRIGNYDAALQELDTALDIYTRIGDRKGFGACLNSIGIVNYRLGHYEVAMTRSLEAIDLLSEEPVDRKLLAEAYLNVGHVLLRFDNAVTAMEQYRKALEVAMPEQHAEIYNDMAVIHVMRGDHRQALESYLNALRQEKHSKRSFVRAILMGNIGNAYARLGKYSTAARYQRLSCDYLARGGDRDHLARTLRNLAESYLQLGRQDDGVAMLRKAISIATETNSEWEIGRSHDAFHEYYLGIRDFERALEHYKKAQGIREKMVSLEKEKTVESLQKSFELERHLKEEEIRQRNNVIQAVIDAQESERQRIARDLHDGVGQLIAAATINLSRLDEMIKRGSTGNGSELEIPLGRAIDILGRVAGDVRTISHALGTSTLRECGLPIALNELLANIDAHPGTRFELMTVGMEERLAEAVEIGLFRVVQELVSNILRHAGASEATIQVVRQGEEIRVTVEDNGTGFDTGVSATGMGLRNIAARASAMGAELHYDSTPGHGTTVMLVVRV